MIIIMTKIIKANETMTAKERVLKTFNLEKTDRVTIGYETNDGVHKRVAEALGIPDGDNEKVKQALGVDYRGVGAPYAGPSLFKPLPDRRVDAVDGCYMRWMEHQTGGYWDFCDFPLANADAETIENYPVANPDDFDYESIGMQLLQHKDKAIHIGGAGVPDIINSNGRIMGMEDTLVNLMVEDEATMHFVDRRLKMRLTVMERTLEMYKGKIDFMWLGEDLGTQHSPMISLDLYRRVFRPRHQKFIDLAKAYNVPVMVHTCGSSSWAYEDFIEMGVRGVDTLQPEAANMSPKYLKDHFGGRLAFRGCISTAGPLAYGSVEDTIKDVKDTLAIMMDGYGYHFAPTHAIQDNTPTENVLAMYQAAHEFGVYR
jgi:uroporphyrinogen decarboxylase